jgi:hypothetical protein
MIAIVSTGGSDSGEQHSIPASSLRAVPPIDVLRLTDRSVCCDAFHSRYDNDAVAHEIAVGLRNHVAEAIVDPELYAPVLGQVGGS